MLGDILAGVMQGMMGGQRAGLQASPIAGVLAALLTPQQGRAAQAFGAGGLPELLSQFRGAGYAEVVESWVSSGPNRPLVPQALEQVFGQARLGEMARVAGLPQQDLVAGLARMLPDVVNGLTPQGQVPAQDAGFGPMLGNVLGALMNARR